MGFFIEELVKTIFIFTGCVLGIIGIDVGICLLHVYFGGDTDTATFLTTIVNGLIAGVLLAYYILRRTGG